MIRNIIFIILFSNVLFCCQNSKLHLTNPIDFNKLVNENRDLVLEIYYKNLVSGKFDNHTSVKMLKEGCFDYKVIVRNDMLTDNIGLLERINDIKLKSKIENYSFIAFTRCDFISKKNGLIYTFGLGDILEENIVWVNNDYYKVENYDYQVLKTIIETFMPFEYAFPKNNLENFLQKILTDDEQSLTN